VTVYPHFIRNRSQCDETIGYMVTAGRFYFCTLRNAHLTAIKATMTAGKIYHGCFEMLSWPYRTSAKIINICLGLLETWTECLYVIEESIRPGAQRWAFDAKYEYTVRRPSIYRGPVVCTWASFQTTSAWVKFPTLAKTSRCETGLQLNFPE